MALAQDIIGSENNPARWGGRHRAGAKRRAGEGGYLATPRPLATETLAEAQHPVLEFAALLDAEVRVTQIILEGRVRNRSLHRPAKGRCQRLPHRPELQHVKAQARERPRSG